MKQQSNVVRSKVHRQHLHICAHVCVRVQHRRCLWLLLLLSFYLSFILRSHDFFCCLLSFGTHLCLSRRQYNFKYLFHRTFRTFSAVNVNSVNVEWTLSISQIEYIFFVPFFTQSPFHNQFYFIFVLIHLSPFFRMIEERNTLY